VRLPRATHLTVLVDGYRKWGWLEKAAYERLLEELAKLDLQINEEKTRRIDLSTGGSFSLSGFDFRRTRTRSGKWGVRITPRMKARTALLSKLKGVFRRFKSQPVEKVIELANPILQGWANYYRVGHSGECFGYVKDWVEKKTRRHLMRARNLKGFGWNRWSRNWLYQNLGLYNDYKIRYYHDSKALPAR
jgi:RNA-directed DNA polymerase